MQLLYTRENSANNWKKNPSSSAELKIKLENSVICLYLSQLRKPKSALFGIFGTSFLTQLPTGFAVFKRHFLLLKQLSTKHAVWNSIAGVIHVVWTDRVDCWCSTALHGDEQLPV